MSDNLAGPIALAKRSATRMAQYVRAFQIGSDSAKANI